MAQAIGSLRRRDLLSAFGPLALWIGVIFFLSSSLGSMSHTSMLIRPVLELLFPLAPDETLRLYHAYVRKAAHFIEYAVLAVFAVRAFSGLTNRHIRTLLYGLLTVVLVSVIDEVNQSFDVRCPVRYFGRYLDACDILDLERSRWSTGNRLRSETE